MGKIRVSEEEAKKRLFEVHGGKIFLVEYFGMANKSKFKCINNHYWEARASSVINEGNGCKICSKKASPTIKEVEEYVASSGCLLISKEYNNIFSPLEIKLECGHIRKISFNNFKKGRRCRLCSWKRMGIDKRTSLDKILLVLEENDLSFVEMDEYKNQVVTKISYSCSKGHITTKNISGFLRNPKCTDCSRDVLSEMFSGRNSPNWKGGKTDIREFMDDKLIDWKKESIKNSGYRCVITGDVFDHVHHLYSFSKIVEESFLELGLDNSKKNTLLYSPEELVLISEKILEIHYRYPLGVCLRRDVHEKFHSIYGKTNNTPNQFYEFAEGIENGNIRI